MRVSTRALIGLAVLGLLLVGVGLIVGTPTVHVEGAYFDRVNGAPTFAGVFSASSPSLFDASDGNLWIGSGVASLIAAAGLATAQRLRRR